MNKKMLNEANQIHNFISSSGSGTVINYGFGSYFLTSYGSGSTSRKVTVPTVPVPQRWLFGASGENQQPDNMGPNGVARLAVRSQDIRLMAPMHIIHHYTGQK